MHIYTHFPLKCLISWAQFDLVAFAFLSSMLPYFSTQIHQFSQGERKFMEFKYWEILWNWNHLSVE